MAEQARKNLNRIKSPENEKLNMNKVAKHARRSQNRQTSPNWEIPPGIPLPIIPVTMMDRSKIGQESSWQGAQTRPVLISDKSFLQVAPHVFINGGKTVAAAFWCGGDGGRGNQYIGDVIYDSGIG
jgi:hypothetical protein